ECDPHLTLQRLEFALHLDPKPGVQRTERLVEEDEGGLHDQCPRQSHALLLAAGQLLDSASSKVLHADGSECTHRLLCPMLDPYPQHPAPAPHSYCPPPLSRPLPLPPSMPQFDARAAEAAFAYLDRLTPREGLAHRLPAAGCLIALITFAPKWSECWGRVDPDQHRNIWTGIYPGVKRRALEVHTVFPPQSIVLAAVKRDLELAGEDVNELLTLVCI